MNHKNASNATEINCKLQKKLCAENTSQIKWL